MNRIEFVDWLKHNINHSSIMDVKEVLDKVQDFPFWTSIPPPQVNVSPVYHKQGCHSSGFCNNCLIFYYDTTCMCMGKECYKCKQWVCGGSIPAVKLTGIFENRCWSRAYLIKYDRGKMIGSMPDTTVMLYENNCPIENPDFSSWSSYEVGKNIDTKAEDFSKYLDDVSKVVEQWPEWKRHILGQIHGN